MTGEHSANRDYNEGRLGFYVVNPQTQFAVAGPLQKMEAHREANQRNAKYPLDPIKLEVVEIVRSRSGATA